MSSLPSPWRWLLWLLLIAIAALAAIQLWYAGWIAWWRWNDPHETSFMRRERVALPTSANLTRLYFLAPDCGWVVGTSGAIFKYGKSP